VNYLIQNTINNNGYEPLVFVVRRTNVPVIEVFQTTVRASPVARGSRAYDAWHRPRTGLARVVPERELHAHVDANVTDQGHEWPASVPS
jgi:hypothetical protein